MNLKQQLENNLKDFWDSNSGIPGYSMNDLFNREVCSKCGGTGKIAVPNGEDDFDYEPCDCQNE